MQIKAHFREGRKSPWEARWWVNQKMRRWQMVDEMLPDVDPVKLAEFWINNH